MNIVNTRALKRNNYSSIAISKMRLTIQNLLQNANVVSDRDGIDFSLCIARPEILIATDTIKKAL